MSNYKISVIIPIYNAQDTIKRSIDSVINQTIGFSNIELILYDDASTDNTIRILKEYDKKYKNIVLLLSNENSGRCGKGRNEGIRIASADYIMFMDSDDEYLPDLCKTLYEEIIKENADIVSSDFLNIDNLSSKKDTISNTYKISKNNKMVFLNDNKYNFINVSACSKIFKKSIIVNNQLKFPEDKLCEDIYFSYLLLHHVNKIIHLEDYIGYLRHIQEESLSNTVNYVKAKEMINVLFDIYSFYRENNLTQIDFSMLFHEHIGFYLRNIYTYNILDSKKEVNELLHYLYTFENEINFNNSYLDTIYRIPNKLIIKKQFKLAIIYLKIMKIFFKSKFMRKFYRVINV